MSKLDYVFDLGGSIVNSGELDAQSLKAFERFCSGYVARGRRLAIIVGGGHITRVYQNFLREHFNPSDEDLDMIGIRPTKLNAELIRIMLSKYAYPRVLESPEESIENPDAYQVFIFSGWKPGWSTDYVSVLVAKRFGVDRVFSLTNIRGVYAKENGKLDLKKVLPRLTWDEYEKMIDKKWTPGTKVPFDPVATREAKRSHIKVVILPGKDLPNVANCLEERSFSGTVIS